MAFYLLTLLLLPLPTFAVRANDPAPGVWQSRTDARGMDCVNLGQALAHERYPAEIPDLPARRLDGPANTLVCTRRFLPPDERRPRDEAILSQLGASVLELTQAATALAPPGLTWHADAFYPDEQVGQKIAVAARMALAETGHVVSDRVPLLTGGDIAVIGRMAPQDGYPLACSRYYAEQVMGMKDAFLGVMILDGRETQLHAGTCIAGTWRWIR